MRKNIEKKDFRMLGQGTYGCTYHPLIRCKDQRSGSTDFLSKVQIKDATSNLELDIGTIVKKIPNHEQRFAPILEQCPINISKIANDELKDCAIIKEGFDGKKTPEYVSSKIRYIGDETLDEYFDRILKPSNTPLRILQKYWKLLGNTQLYLLNSVRILNSAGILHLDMKSNNIMRDKGQQSFVIIDFGLSYEIKNLKRENYAKYTEKPMGVLANTYVTWPVEMILLSHIARTMQEELPDREYGPLKTELWSKKIEDMMRLKNICSVFVKENRLLQNKMFSNEERVDYLKRLHNWMDTMRGKTLGEIWDTIAKSHLSWDAYGISTMYLDELDNMNIISYLQDLPTLKKADPKLQKQATNTVTQIVTGKNPQETHHTYFMQEYVKCMKRHVLSDPETRSSASQLGNEIQIIFKKIDRLSYDVMNEKLAPKIFDKKNQEKIKKVKAKNTTRALIEKNQMRTGIYA